MHHRIATVLGLILLPMVAAAEKPSGTSGELTSADYERLNRNFGDLEADAYDTPPRVVKGYNPLYPASRLMSRQTGVCVIRFSIPPSGRAERIEVESGDEKMCDHAVYAFKLWQFAPATKDGKPVTTRLQVPISYDIK